MKNLIRTVLMGAGLISLLGLSGTASAEHGRNNVYSERGSGDVILFEHSDYRGRQLQVDRPVTDLNNLGFNDKASSIAIRRGSWEVCTDGYFRGRCQIFSNNSEALGYFGLNDKISSIRPASNYGRASGHGYDWGHNNGYRWGQDTQDARYAHSSRGYERSDIILYEHSDFKGRALALDRQVDDLSSVGFNDKASSLRVNKGRWLVCVDGYFRGRCEIVTNAHRNFGYFDMNDKISSVRRIG